jgi:hypothetical protein
MPPEKESHIEFNDDTIAKASAEAINLGKKSFEEQKNAFGAVQNDTNDGANEETGKENQPVVIKSLRTYQGDIAEAIKNQNASVLTIAMAEQQRVGKREEENEKEEFKPRTILQRIKGEKPKPRIPTPEFVPPRIEPKPRQAPTTFTPPPVFNVPPTQSASIKPNKPEFPSKIVFGQSPQKKINDSFRRDTITIAISILLILLGIGAVTGFYFLQKTPPKPATAPASELTIIPYDTKEIISTTYLDRESLLQKLNAIRRGAPIANGSVHYVELTSGATSTTPISTNDLFSILNTNIPGNALRAFGPSFMFGFYGINGNQPFILISLNSFENAYAGMLEWEKDMNTDVGAIFAPSAVSLTQYVPIATSSVASLGGGKNVTATGTAAITTIANLGPTPNSQFGDITIQNKDARVLKNARAETILLYSFINQNTLLITTNESVLSAMIGKFTQQQYTR